jgi:hypothetical protein
MMFLRVGVVAAGVLIAALAGLAQAAPLFYSFELDFIAGPLNGEKDRGSISVDGNDCPLGVCVGTFDPTNALDRLLSLNITVGGVPFAMTDDTGFGFGPYPSVVFDTGGHFSQIDYQGQRTFGGSSYVLDMTSLSGGIILGKGLAAFYQGTADNPTSLVSTALARAPEPGTVPLLAVALIGMAWAWRRRASVRHPLTVDALAG